MKILYIEFGVCVEGLSYLRVAFLSYINVIYPINIRNAPREAHELVRSVSLSDRIRRGKGAL